MSRFVLPLILQIIDLGSVPSIFPLEIEMFLILQLIVRLQSNKLLTTFHLKFLIPNIEFVKKIIWDWNHHR